ncbi:MAG: hypothetical protein ACK4WH_14865 [Phycisphaerales bacterium]
MRCLALISALSFSLPAAPAAPPTLLADLIVAASNPGSRPLPMVYTPGSSLPTEFGLIVTQATGTTTPTIWKTNGEPGSAERFEGLPSWNSAQAARTADGRVLVSLNRDGIGTSLYALNTTSLASTLIREGGGTGRPQVVAGRFVFPSGDPDHGNELWVSDGTPSGTSLLIDIAPGSPDSNPELIAGTPDRAFFVARSAPSSPLELWVTDGTITGTRLVGNVSPESEPQVRIRRAVPLVDGVLYATLASDPALARIYFSDGTSPAAAPLPVFTAIQSPAVILSSGSHALITGADSGGVRHLYITDGTAAGTIPISESAVPATGGVVVHDAAAPFGWVVFLAAGDQTTGVELYRSNGTRAGTSLVADLNPGADPSSPANFTLLQDVVYFNTTSFVGAGSYFGSFFAVSATAGTITDLAIGNPDAPASIAPMTAANGRVFLAATGEQGRELWAYRPDSGMFAFVQDLAPPESSSTPLLVLSAEDVAVYSAGQPVTPRAMYQVAGDPLTARAVALDGAPLLAQNSASCAYPIGDFGDSVVLFGSTPITGSEPFVIERTDASARPLADIVPGPSDSIPLGNCTGSFIATSVGVRSVFASYSGLPLSSGAAYSIWSTGGVPGDAERIASFKNFPGPSVEIFNFVRLNDRAYFFAPFRNTELGAGRVDLWVTDGTSANTNRAVSLATVLGSGNPSALTRFGSRLFFLGTTPGSLATTLFVTDGTLTGTARLPLPPESEGFQPTRLAASRSGLLVVLEREDRSTLWITDGLSGGINTELLPADGDSRYAMMSMFTGADHLVYFARWEHQAGRELWVTDGTVERTRMVLDIAPGASSGDPRSMVRIGPGRIAFTAFSPESGVELWQSDGTALGTRRVADLNPGPQSSSPQALARVNNSVVMSADDGSGAGRELWSWLIVPACGCDADSDGIAGLQDIYDYLPLWFAAEPRADINSQHGVTVQDLFDFLVCWFAGCE